MAPSEKPIGLHSVFNTVAKENFADFAHLEWCCVLRDDQSFTHTSLRDRSFDVAGSRTMLAETLWTSDTVRSLCAFHRGSLPPEFNASFSEATVPNVSPAITKESYPHLPEVRLLVSLGRGMTGHIDHLHGGVTALLLDEAMGFAIYAQNLWGQATVSLKAEYKKGIPTPGVVLCRAWIERIEGKKIWTRGVVEDGMGKDGTEGVVYARGEGLFVRLRRGKL